MKKGISLVALVITIIVLIILTTAVILTVSNDGILDKAQYAADEKSKLEVYSAVQREVLNVQNEKREIAFGTDFANELKIRLDKKHPASDSIVEYNPSEDEIDIIFTANNKKYNLCLDNKYRLTMLTDDEIANKSIIEERKLIQSHVDGVEIDNSRAALEKILPEGWDVLMDDNIYRVYILHSANGNTFYYNYIDKKIIGEKIGSEEIQWVYNGQIAHYWGSQQEIDLTQMTVLSNVYEEVEVGDEIVRYVKRDDVNVSDVSNYSFRDNYKIKKVILPNNIDKILEEAFRECLCLESFVIPENVTEIGRAAFLDSKLTNVSIPNKVINIGNSAFWGTKITSVEIPNSVQNIGIYAFCGSNNLTNVSIPSSVKNIGNKAFDCANLTTIKVGSDAVKKLVEASGFAGTVEVDTTIG